MRIKNHVVNLETTDGEIEVVLKKAWHLRTGSRQSVALAYLLVPEALHSNLQAVSSHGLGSGRPLKFFSL
jgi:hypothetical protein